MRADRLISILMLLERHTYRTSQQLASELEVSTRTIQRDMDAMSVAGIPVYAERGRNGGWRLMDDYKNSLNNLNHNEIQSLFLSAPDVVLDALGIRHTNRRALSKLERNISEAAQKRAFDLQNFIYIDVEGWHEVESNTTHLPTLQTALWNQKQLHMIYQRGDGTVVERDVTPFGLVSKGLKWYLIAGDRDNIKTYRHDRIQTVEITGDGVPHPENFDLAIYWQENKRSFRAQLPKILVKFHVKEAILARLQHAGWYSKIITSEPMQQSHWVEVMMAFNTEEDAVSLAASFGDELILIEPEELRERVVKQAKSLLAAYVSDAERTIV